MIQTKAKSHRQLGEYLAEHYLHGVPRRYIRAFLLGCTEPDRNPSTYLKGSIRSQWMRGHNWENAQRYMARIAGRLERRNKLLLADYYTMGKLIHYTVDAFTYAHNEAFTGTLPAHRSYEEELQAFFLSYLPRRSRQFPVMSGSVMEAIRTYHREYADRPSDIRRDSRYCVLVTSTVVSMLLARAA